MQSRQQRAGEASAARAQLQANTWRKCYMIGYTLVLIGTCVLIGGIAMRAGSNYNVYSSSYQTGLYLLIAGIIVKVIGWVIVFYGRYTLYSALGTLRRTRAVRTVYVTPQQAPGHYAQPGPYAQPPPPQQLNAGSTPAGFSNPNNYATQYGPPGGVAPPPYEPAKAQ